MKEDRGHPRNRTFLPARVEIGELGIAMPCTIRDLSDGGARLQFTASVTLPPSFELHIPKFDRTVTVQQRWRRGDFVGVSFEANAEIASTRDAPPVQTDAYTRRLEAEITQLKLLVAAIREDPSRARQLLDRDAA